MPVLIRLCCVGFFRLFYIWWYYGGFFPLIDFRVTGVVGLNGLSPLPPTISGYTYSISSSRYSSLLSRLTRLIYFLFNFAPWPFGVVGRPPPGLFKFDAAYTSSYRFFRSSVCERVGELCCGWGC